MRKRGTILLNVTPTKANNAKRTITIGLPVACIVAGVLGVGVFGVKRQVNNSYTHYIKRVNKILTYGSLRVILVL